MLMDDDGLFTSLEVVVFRTFSLEDVTVKRDVLDRCSCSLIILEPMGSSPLDAKDDGDRCCCGCVE